MSLSLSPPRVLGASVLRMLALLCLLLPGPIQAFAADGWVVVDVLGGARELNTAAGAESARPLRQGDQVQPGHTVVTDPGGRLVLRLGGDVITFKGGSHAQLPVAAATATTRILQKFGDLIFRISARSSGRFQVETPLMVAAVKGTVFAVHVGPEGARVSVMEGAVEIRALRSDQLLVVAAGQSVDVVSPIQPALSLREIDPHDRAELAAPAQNPAQNAPLALQSRTQADAKRISPSGGQGAPTARSARGEGAEEGAAAALASAVVRATAVRAPAFLVTVATIAVGVAAVGAVIGLYLRFRQWYRQRRRSLARSGAADGRGDGR